MNVCYRVTVVVRARRSVLSLATFGWPVYGLQHTWMVLTMTASVVVSNTKVVNLTENRIIAYNGRGVDPGGLDWSLIASYIIRRWLTPCFIWVS